MKTTSPSQTEETGVQNNFTLLTTAVVLVAEQHNPAVINPDFLRNRGIVPKEWEPHMLDSVSIPLHAQVAYKNGVAIVVTPNHCSFEQRVNGTPGNSHHVHEYARRYAEKLEYNYIAVGLNWQLQSAHAHPEKWIKNRFFLPGWRKTMRPSTIAFSIPVPGKNFAVCNFTLRIQQMRSQQGEIAESVLLLGCNIHCALRSSARRTKQISNILKDWKDYQSFLSKAVTEYFEEDLS